MADVIVLHAPKDQEMARAIASGLGGVRVLTMPVTGRRAYFDLGERMVRLVAWSAEANGKLVLPILQELNRAGKAPMALVLCDQTPPPDDLVQAAHATIAFRGGAEKRRELVASTVQSLLAARPPAAPEKPGKGLARIGALGLALVGLAAVGAVASVGNWGPQISELKGIAPPAPSAAAAASGTELLVAEPMSEPAVAEALAPVVLAPVSSEPSGAPLMADAGDIITATQEVAAPTAEIAIDAPVQAGPAAAGAEAEEEEAPALIGPSL